MGEVAWIGEDDQAFAAGWRLAETKGGDGHDKRYDDDLRRTQGGKDAVNFVPDPQRHIE